MSTDGPIATKIQGSQPLLFGSTVIVFTDIEYNPLNWLQWTLPNVMQ